MPRVGELSETGLAPVVTTATLPQPLIDREREPTWAETTGAAFRQENDVYNAIEYVLRQRHAPQEGFNVKEFVEKTHPGMIESGEALPYAKVQSEAEFYDLYNRIAKEDRDREILARSGASGFALAVAAGLFSPTTFLPLVGVGAKGLKAAAQGAAYTGAGIAVQEGILQFTQERRTAAETAMGIGAGIALGGILGGAVGLVRGSRQAKIERMLANDMIDTGDEGVNVAIPKPGEASSVGAARSFDVPTGTQGFAGRQEGMFSKFGVGKWSLEALSPVTRLLNHPYAVARHTIAKFSDAGLKLAGLEEGKVGAEGGSITALRAGWNAYLAKGLVGIDRIFAEYVFGDAGKKLFASTRAIIEAQRNPKLLTSNEFNAAISRYMRAGENWKGIEGDLKATEAVKKAGDLMRREVYTPIFEEAKRLGMFPEDIKVVGDAEYLNRLYNIPYIKAHQNDFIDILADHIRGKRMNEFQASGKKTTAKLKEIDQEIEDLATPADEVEGKTKSLEQQLADLNTSPVREVMDELLWLREEAKGWTEVGQNKLAKELLDTAEALEEANLKEIEKFKDVTKTIRKRLRTLTQTAGSIGKRRDAKLRRITALEQSQLGRFDRVSRAYAKMKKELDSGKLSPVKAKEKFDKLQGQVQRALQYVLKREVALADIANDDGGDITKLLGMEAVDQKKVRLETLAAQLNKQAEYVDNLDDIRVAVAEQYVAVRETGRDLVSRKALRIARLKEEVKKLDPDGVQTRIESLKERTKQKRADFVDRWRERGFDDVELADDIDMAPAGIDNGARDIAQEIVGKIIGSPLGRLAHYDMLAMEGRGPELVRLLNIPSEKIEPFLENNAERLMRAYVRTMAPDIEIFRKFGSVNAKGMFEELEAEHRRNIELARSVTNKQETLDDLRKQLKESTDAGERQKLRNQINIVKGDMTTADLNAAYEAAVRDLGAVIGRMRHTWGVPEDPTGWAARGVRIAQNLNTLRMMGMVAVSSIPDIARTVMKFGPVRAYQAGLKPLFAGFKEMKLSAREAQFAGTALDPILHTRMYELMDLADNFAARTRGEQALEFMTSKMGIVSGFDYWNFWMKSLAGVITNAEILDNIATVIDKTHKGLRTPKQASDYLATVNIDGAAAHDIWRLVNEAGGGGKVNGVWMPATDEWKDAGVKLGMSPQRVAELTRIYRGAMVREIDTTIVTPGVERPLWMDKTLTGKLLGQFRSFTFSSTQHTLMAGLQEKDARFALGTAMSLALGGLSYYLWTLSAQEEGERDHSWEKFVDEAIDRSGALGVISEVRSMGSTIPWMNDYLMLSGERTTRRGGEGTVGTILGPSIDLAESIAGLMNQLDSPTEGTANQARKLMPFNNVWYLRRVFDKLVEGMDLPERRETQ